ncbi:MAG: putative bifunctional diguanylate cyclase/phosphodiesterase [Limnospira sp.]
MDSPNFSNPHPNRENLNFFPADPGRCYSVIPYYYGQTPELTEAFSIEDFFAIAVSNPASSLPDGAKEPFRYRPLRAPQPAPEHRAGPETTERRYGDIRGIYDTRDGLTSLYNRSGFIDQLDAAVKRVQRRRNYQFGVLFIDLDRFKIINDSLGHQVGDRLLAAVGRRLRECIPPWNVVARLGGDEFAVLLDPVQNPTQISRFAEVIQHHLQQPILLGEHEIFTTASIGITLSDIGYDCGKEILRDADTALYQAKIKGKACHVIFNPTMHRQARERLQLESDLRRAIQRQQLRLHYQPIVSPTTRQILGCEALVRWQHPRLGLVSPAQFIPIAEETGLIRPIGEWVLREACTAVRKWQLMFPQGQPPFVSVNLSSHQLTQPEFTQTVGAILKETGCPPSCLKLELTESTIAEYAEMVIPKMQELSRLGIQLCIDDFGTGYSSLSRLYDFPIHTLKIDRSFVEGIDESREKLKIAQAIVNLAHTLGMEAIAEGVETPEQLAVLQAWECQLCQGFLFSRAVGEMEMEQLLVLGSIHLSPAQTLREWKRFADEIENLAHPVGIEKNGKNASGRDIHIA